MQLYEYLHTVKIKKMKTLLFLLITATAFGQSKKSGVYLEKQYYFSTKGDGKLMSLTINNIKQAFPNNHKFHDMIDAQFQITNIWEYDTFHKTFKVNH